MNCGKCVDTICGGQGIDFENSYCSGYGANSNQVAEVESKHGIWIKEIMFCVDYESGDRSHVPYYKCSACEHSYPYNQPNYCPNCGAKMDANNSTEQKT